MPRPHESMENSHERMGSHEHMGSHGSHEHMGSHGSREHMGSHESHEHSGSSESHEDGESYWQGCSQRFWGDDKHEAEAKRIAMGALLAAVVLIIVIVIVTVVLCRRRRYRARCAAKHQKLDEQHSISEDFDPDKHPKAKEAYPVVLVAPANQGTKGQEAGPNDPRLTLGVWSPPPAYVEMK